MKNNPSKHTDELFREVLKQHEAVFEPAAWDNMRALLDEDDKKPVLIVPPPSKNKPKFLIFIIMTTLSFISIATYMLMSPAQVNSDGKPGSSVNPELSAPLSGDNQTGSEISETEFNSASLEKPLKGPNANGNSNTSESANSQANNGSGNTLSDDSLFKPLVSSVRTFGKYTDSVATVSENGRTYRLFYRKMWVDPQYKYIEKKSSGVINDGFIGIHFTAQRLRNTDSMNAGFNLQFMSGNRLDHNHLGIYAGFDWGMQFYGKSRKTNVVLNNTSQDSGFTRLQTYSMDFLGRAHFEYAKFPIVPYFNLMAGPRLYSTGQLVKSYVNFKDVDNSTTNNAHTSVSMMYGFGFGARIKLSPVVSLDARYEWMNGSPVKLVDMNNSTFNGLNYDLKYNRITPKLEHFKFGLIFNISEREYDKTLVKEGYFKEIAVDSVELNPSDSNTIYIPCKCLPCDQTSNTYRPDVNSGEEENNNSSRPYQAPSGNSGGKGSFPGIKPPSRPTEIKR